MRSVYNKCSKWCPFTQTHAQSHFILGSTPVCQQYRCRWPFALFSAYTTTRLCCYWSSLYPLFRPYLHLLLFELELGSWKLTAWWDVSTGREVIARSTSRGRWQEICSQLLIINVRWTWASEERKKYTFKGRSQVVMPPSMRSAWT